jgi:peptidyl-prolyl cis-trans isomerase SurA
MQNIKILLIPVLFVFFISCKSSQTNINNSTAEKTSLFTIDSIPTYTEEFIYAYEKSNKNKGEIEPVEDYLDLYINFKLKVAAAKSAGLDTTESYLNELNGYLEEIKKTIKSEK